ncbi:osteoclast stimulatory transmembrane protein [Sorex araneus]|uniref:osteoclast stimulatory transmembrane protein n=1 Tax=Sorex araneus TaxID=42254 RepID=UPI002433ABF3|nr:osteoclast stimulatory transmembrane protein [Sorex araneus]
MRRACPAGPASRESLGAGAGAGGRLAHVQAESEPPSAAAQSPVLGPVRCRFWPSGLCKALVPLQAAWLTFSQPVPASCGQLLTQLLLCSCLAVAAASLAHQWLVSSLLCPPGPSAAAATVCALLLFLLLGLVAPARCLFALSVPALGTKQGRRLLLSCSSATLATAAVPRVLANLGAVGRVLRCVTEGSMENLLNTTHQLHAAARALHPSGHRAVSVQPQGDAAAFRTHMLGVTQQVLADFSDLESLARGAALGVQRLVGGLFVLGLLVDSAQYLHRYLTDLRFDNIYGTGQLVQRLQQAGDTHLVAPPPPWLVWAARPRLSPQELLSCLPKLATLTPFLLATALTAATDHVAFLLAQAAVGWARELPVVPITLTVQYNATYTVLRFIPFLFNQPPAESPFASTQRSLEWELRFTSPACPLLAPQPPHRAAHLAAGALQLLAGSAVLLETYAGRLRHAIAASFFPDHEAQRVRYLHVRLQRRCPRGPPSRPPRPDLPAGTQSGKAGH